MRRVGPARRNPVDGPLERELAQPRPGTDDDPVTEVLIDTHAWLGRRSPAARAQIIYSGAASAIRPPLSFSFP
jgi:hypothetical protein